ncbi:ABC transporter substrate-binding protein [Rhizocola hellebori]|uniref:ABC transporter substrate-binding protein n=1 Tax=Rhizocola hellebori TaxID=1392758 RepID=A0A8J3Q6C8_9ACTN|nr:MCE family protein [Rhizocola hellebori]GIH04636.1 ABC transporter substrate-binding protein [Rhizocola hellebori]
MRRLLGAAFVALLAGLLATSVLVYRKAFTSVSWVTLQTTHAGMQLSQGADVKYRGVIVGDVRSISANGSTATLRLALDPALIGHIPADVSARLLPKTLFGERYVELVGAGSGPALRAGVTIGQDRSENAVELERILDQALPLLQAIKPDKLAATLGALAYALDGRGNRLGNDLAVANGYLAALNEQMPTIEADVRRLSAVLDFYHGALPDLLEVLRNVTVTATTVSQQRDQLSRFLISTTDLAQGADRVLTTHEARIIQLGQVSRPVLELLAAYAPEYPCLLKGLVTLQPRVEKVFATGRMHITLEVTKDNGKFVKGRDEPVYGAHNGPDCHGLPGNVHVPAPGVELNDGYDYGVERQLLKGLLAVNSGTTPDQVPDLATLLWGPLLRGTVVNAS